MRALEHGFFLCSKLKSSLTILYVIEIPPFLYIQSQKLVDSIMLTLENEAKGILIDGKIQGKKYNIDPDSLFLEEGNIGLIIVKRIVLILLLLEVKVRGILKMLY